MTKLYFILGLVEFLVFDIIIIVNMAASHCSIKSLYEYGINVFGKTKFWLYWILYVISCWILWPIGLIMFIRNCIVELKIILLSRKIKKTKEELDFVFNGYKRD